MPPVAQSRAVALGEDFWVVWVATSSEQVRCRCCRLPGLRPPRAWPRWVIRKVVIIGVTVRWVARFVPAVEGLSQAVPREQKSHRFLGSVPVETQWMAKTISFHTTTVAVRRSARDVFVTGPNAICRFIFHQRQTTFCGASARRVRPIIVLSRPSSVKLPRRKR